MVATAALSRRSFLSGKFSRPVAELRPPWALPPAAFEQACTRCDACIKACPSGIVRRGTGGFPGIDFLRGTGLCTFCGDCLSACLPQALRRQPGISPAQSQWQQPWQQPWQLKAGISVNCLAQQNVVCRSCGDACAEAAIRFRPRLGGAAWPEIDLSNCTGCGACVGTCPVRAIAVTDHPDP